MPAKRAKKAPSSRRAAAAPPARQFTPRPGHRYKVGLFPSTEQAQAYVSFVQSESRRRGFSPTASWYNNAINQFGGIPSGSVASSASRREVRSYDYQMRIWPQDRIYLFERDVTARMICEDPPLMAWHRLPETLDPAIDDYFDDLTDLGLPQAASAAHALARRDGGAWLYINATGEPTEPIGARDELLGFDLISGYDVVDEPTTTIQVAPEERGRDPVLRQHGFKSIAFFATPEDKARNFPTVVHGSRLVNFNFDRYSKWWHGRSYLDVRFDVLWNLRDVEFAQKHGQIQGNPIAAYVDVENEFSSSDDADDDLAAEIVEFREGSRDMFSSVEGLELKRLGAADLDDPDKVIRLLASRASHGTEYTVNQILASSRGSEQVTDQDIKMHIGAIRVKTQETQVRPILSHLVRIGHATNLVPRRRRLPRQMVWPDLITLLPEERTRVLRGEADAVNKALKSGRLAPPEVERRWRPNLTPIDTRFVLPSVAAKETLGEDGEPIDPNDKPAPGDDSEEA
jgi:hypothetical protein